LFLFNCVLPVPDRSNGDSSDLWSIANRLKIALHHAAFDAACNAIGMPKTFQKSIEVDAPPNKTELREMGQSMGRNGVTTEGARTSRFA
jgi:hypothetical protein